MKNYEDSRIRFAYAEDFKVTRAKRKWGQYDLEARRGFLKGGMSVTICLVPEDALDDLKRSITDSPSAPPGMISGLEEVQRYRSVTIGDKHGVGLCAVLFDASGLFWGKRYDYLFYLPKGGLSVVIDAREDFTIESYKELLESIVVKTIE